jgi:hypothetical protein
VPDCNEQIIIFIQETKHDIIFPTHQRSYITCATGCIFSGSPGISISAGMAAIESDIPGAPNAKSTCALSSATGANRSCWNSPDIIYKRIKKSPPFIAYTLSMQSHLPQTASAAIPNKKRGEKHKNNKIDGWDDGS